MDRFNNNYLPGDDILQQDQRSHLPAQQSPHGQTQAQQQVLPQSSHQPAPPIVEEEELLAAQAAAEAAAAQQALQPGGAFNNVGQGLSGKYRDMMMQYWQETINSIEHDDHDFKNHQLPLARIKKVMKTDEDVRMISAEAPILFAKGCDVFITELTMRAWIHAEENKRRTLQKSDIAAALTKSDMFDFLIDVVPREEEKAKKYSQARTNGYSHPSYQEPVPQQLLQQPYEEVSHQQPLQQQQEQPQPQQLPQLPHQLPHQLPQQSQQFQSHLQQSTPTQEERSEQSEYMSQPDQTFPGKQEEEFAPQYQNPVGEDVLQQQMLHQQVMGQQESSPRPPCQQFNLYNQGYSEYQ